MTILTIIAEEWLYPFAILQAKRKAEMLKFVFLCHLPKLNLKLSFVKCPCLSVFCTLKTIFIIHISSVNER